MSAKELTEEDLAERALTGTREAHVIAARIATEHGVPLEVIIGPRRDAHVMRARHALYEALRAVGWGYTVIARFCGNRDHSTVQKVLKSRKRKAQASARQEARGHWLGAAGPYIDGLVGRARPLDSFDDVGRRLAPRRRDRQGRASGRVSAHSASARSCGLMYQKPPSKKP